jgi:hypothetical protein
MGDGILAEFISVVDAVECAPTRQSSAGPGAKSIFSSTASTRKAKVVIRLKLKRRYVLLFSGSCSLHGRGRAGRRALGDAQCWRARFFNIRHLDRESGEDPHELSGLFR